MILADALRPPSPHDPSAAAYKDWLHLNVLDHASGAVGLINVSLHGAPDDPRSRAVGTALLHLPEGRWVGNAEVVGLGEAAIGAASIGLERVALAVTRDSGAVLASVRFAQDDLELSLTAAAAASGVAVERRLPLGSGWISWYVVPRLGVSGGGTIAGRRADLSAASAYHDHNWGRWHWGGDLGWEWGCFLPPRPGPAFVLSRTTDRAHRNAQEPLLVVHAGGRRRTFQGAAVELEYGGRLETVLRRVPGALAALHSDRSAARLPRTLRLRADDGVDLVEIDFVARAAAQLVAGDPVVPGYGFIHEIVGEFTFACRLESGSSTGSGLAVVEYVD